jgi:hypothetical protein
MLGGGNAVRHGRRVRRGMELELPIGRDVGRSSGEAIMIGKQAKGRCYARPSLLQKWRKNRGVDSAATAPRGTTEGLGPVRHRAGCSDVTRLACSVGHERCSGVW